MKKNHLKKYGPWAIITGATDGIGKAIAEQLAKLGYNLVLVARREAVLQQLSSLLQESHGVDIRIIAADLSREKALSEIERETGDLDIGLLVAAAGYGTTGDFVDANLSDELNMIDVNCRSVVQQCQYFGRRFQQRGSGGMILFSSVFAFQGVPRSANYAATKAFIQSFAEALHDELVPSNIDVLAAAYGPVKTGFATRADMVMKFAQSPTAVATATLNALGNTTTSRPGALSKLLGYSLGMLPRRLRTWILSMVVADMTRHQSHAQQTH